MIVRIVIDKIEKHKYNPRAKFATVVTKVFTTIEANGQNWKKVWQYSRKAEQDWAKFKDGKADKAVDALKDTVWDDPEVWDFSMENLLQDIRTWIENEITGTTTEDVPGYAGREFEYDSDTKEIEEVS